VLQNSGLPLLFVYFFEPTEFEAFYLFAIGGFIIYESISRLTNQVKPKQILNSTSFHSEVQPHFAELLKHYDINTFFSHQEIGNKYLR
jgi:deoxyribodipyrimidine photo-lyase